MNRKYFGGVAFLFAMFIFLIFAQVTLFADSSAGSEFGQEIEHGSHFLELVDGNENILTGARVEFDTVAVSPLEQETTAVLGIDGHIDPAEDLIIYIGNGTTNPEWTVNINAVDALNGLWESNTDTYDYKNRLTVDPSNIAINPVADCSTDGFSPFIGSTFEDSSPINLIGATNLADPVCAWLVTGVDLEQLIPGRTPEGIYTLNMELTMN
jgi:hypothetical protein